MTWRAGLTAGQALYHDFNSGTTIQAQLDMGASYLGKAVDFFRNHLKPSYRSLEPHDELIASDSPGPLNADLFTPQGKRLYTFSSRLSMGHGSVISLGGINCPSGHYILTICSGEQRISKNLVVIK